MKNLIPTKLLILTLALASGIMACSSDKKSAPGTDSEKPAPASALLAQGTIKLAPEVVEKAPSLGVLFVMARNNKGQLIAVKRLLPPFQYPVAFEITEADQMIQGLPISDSFTVSVRLDADGDANPAQAGDILSTGTFQVKRGQKGLPITLNKLVE